MFPFLGYNKSAKPARGDPHSSSHGDDSLRAPVEQAHTKLGALHEALGVLGHKPAEIMKLFKNGKAVDYTNLYQIVAALPDGGSAQTMATEMAVDSLWDKMLHPPLSYLGNRFEYRTADGSYNSVTTPWLGQAGTPYAKSIPGKVPMLGSRPDPGDLFDMLMGRQSDEDADFVPSPKGLSSLILYHATIVIHDIFRTSSTDRNISEASSYLDLSPLYGSSQKVQDSVRTFKDGMLHPDTFAEERLFGQPPGVCVLLVMYNRFHNYTAKQLLEINDNGRFSYPAHFEGEDRKKALKKQDNDLFQTARLVTCGLYASISVMDYLRGFIGIHSVDTSWTLDPRNSIGQKYDGQGVPRGIGNQVSVEFNLLYRFHGPLSQKDGKWTGEMWKSVFGKDVDVTTMNLDEFDKGLWKNMEEIKAQLPQDRILYDYDGTPLHRGPDGKFNDKQLVSIFNLAMNDPAGSFGARNIPKALRVVEILGILQARKWQVCSLNEYREFFGMEPHKTFEDVNTDSDIQDALRTLYEHPDMIELYPGIFCEGVGRTLEPPIKYKPGYGLWSGIFSDAVTLVRSDRFYTVDWTVAGLTGWGMKEVSPNGSILKGSMFYKLIERAFPGWYKYNHIQMFSPMHIIKQNLKYAEAQKKTDLFVNVEPSKPAEKRIITDYYQIKAILKDHEHFKNPAFTELHMVTDQKLKEFLVYLDQNLPQRRWKQALEKAAKSQGGTEHTFMEYFTGMASVIEKRERLKYLKGIDPDTKKSYDTYQIDIVKDFAVPVISRFVGDFLGLKLSSKTTTHPGEEISENEFYKIITDYQLYLNHNDDYSSTWRRRAAFMESMQTIVTMFTSHRFKFQHAALDHTGVQGVLNWWYGNKPDPLELETHDVGHKVRALGDFVAKEFDNGKRTGLEIMTAKFLIALEGAYNTVLMFTEILNWLLSPTEENQAIWTKIKTLANNEPDEQKANAEIMQWVMEIQRVTLTLPLARHVEKDMDNFTWKEPYTTDPSRTVERCVVDSNGKSAPFRKGDLLVLDLGAASMQASVFSNPDKVFINTEDREAKDYINYSHGSDKKSQEISIIALTALIRHAARMRNLRLGNDSSGYLKKVKQNSGRASYMTPDWSEFVPFPTTWKLRFDSSDGPYKWRDPAKSRHDSTVARLYHPDGESVDGGTMPDFDSPVTKKKATEGANGRPVGCPVGRS